ncbi:hypothetical protein SK128_006911, partial [Halocaridina rubra]
METQVKDIDKHPQLETSSLPNQSRIDSELTSLHSENSDGESDLKYPPVEDENSDKLPFSRDESLSPEIGPRRRSKTPLTPGRKLLKIHVFERELASASNNEKQAVISGVSEYDDASGAKVGIEGGDSDASGKYLKPEFHSSQKDYECTSPEELSLISDNCRRKDCLISASKRGETITKSNTIEKIPCKSSNNPPPHDEPVQSEIFFATTDGDRTSDEKGGGTPTEKGINTSTEREIGTSTEKESNTFAEKESGTFTLQECGIRAVKSDDTNNVDKCIVLGNDKVNVAGDNKEKFSCRLEESDIIAKQRNNVTIDDTDMVSRNENMQSLDGSDRERIVTTLGDAEAVDEAITNEPEVLSDEGTMSSENRRDIFFSSLNKKNLQNEKYEDIENKDEKEEFGVPEAGMRDANNVDRKVITREDNTISTSQKTFANSACLLEESPSQVDLEQRACDIGKTSAKKNKWDTEGGKQIDDRYEIKNDHTPSQEECAEKNLGNDVHVQNDASSLAECKRNDILLKKREDLVSNKNTKSKDKSVEVLPPTACGTLLAVNEENDDLSVDEKLKSVDGDQEHSSDGRDLEMKIPSTSKETQVKKIYNENREEKTDGTDKNIVDSSEKTTSCQVEESSNENKISAVSKTVVGDPSHIKLSKKLTLHRKNSYDEKSKVTDETTDKILPEHSKRDSYGYCSLQSPGSSEEEKEPSTLTGLSQKNSFSITLTKGQTNQTNNSDNDQIDQSNTSKAGSRNCLGNVTISKNNEKYPAVASEVSITKPLVSPLDNVDDKNIEKEDGSVLQQGTASITKSVVSPVDKVDDKTVEMQDCSVLKQGAASITESTLDKVYEKTVEEEDVSILKQGFERKTQAVESGNELVDRVDYIDLSGDEESADHEVTTMSRVCKKCCDIWNDEVLRIIFKGAECVTVNSRITYGAIVCINSWINRNVTGNKEKAIISIFERADLGRNIAKLNISKLDDWLAQLLKSKKNKCCEVFTAVYSSEKDLGIATSPKASKHGKLLCKKQKHSNLPSKLPTHEMSTTQKPSQKGVTVPQTTKPAEVVGAFPKISQNEKSLQSYNTAAPPGHVFLVPSGSSPANSSASVSKPYKVVVPGVSTSSKSGSNVPTKNSSGVTMPVSKTSKLAYNVKGKSPEKNTPRNIVNKSTPHFTASVTDSLEHDSRSTLMSAGHDKSKELKTVGSSSYSRDIGASSSSEKSILKHMLRKCKVTEDKSPMRKSDADVLRMSDVKITPKLQYPSLESFGKSSTSKPVSSKLGAKVVVTNDDDSNDDVDDDGFDDSYFDETDLGNKKKTTVDGAPDIEEYSTAGETQSLFKLLGIDLRTSNIYMAYVVHPPVTNGTIVKNPPSNSELKKSFFTMIKERSALHGVAREAYDLLMFEPQNFEMKNPDSKMSNRFVTKRELLTLQSLCILNAETPDANVFYEIFLQILLSRNQVLIIPDSRTLLLVTEEIRKVYNRARIKSASIQILNENWDPDRLYSTSDPLLCKENLPNEPKVRDVIAIFCTWKSLEKKSPDPPFNEALQILCKNVNIKGVDKFGICIQLFVKYCRYLYEEKNTLVTKMFLDEPFYGLQTIGSKQKLLAKQKALKEKLTIIERMNAEETAIDDCVKNFVEAHAKASSDLNFHNYEEMINSFVGMKTKLKRFSADGEVIHKRIKSLEGKKGSLARLVKTPQSKYLMKQLQNCIVNLHNLTLKRPIEDSENDLETKTLKKLKTNHRSDESAPEANVIPPQSQALIEKLLRKGVKPEQVRNVVYTVMTNFDIKRDIPLRLPTDSLKYFQVTNMYLESFDLWEQYRVLC